VHQLGVGDPYPLEHVGSMLLEVVLHLRLCYLVEDVEEQLVLPIVGVWVPDLLFGVLLSRFRYLLGQFIQWPRLGQ
jgi:hypothetical protein